jgi:hypothetical protein
MMQGHTLVRSAAASGLVGSTSLGQGLAEANLPSDQVHVPYGSPPGSAADIYERRVACGQMIPYCTGIELPEGVAAQP